MCFNESSKPSVLSECIFLSSQFQTFSQILDIEVKFSKQNIAASSGKDFGKIASSFGTVVFYVLVPYESNFIIELYLKLFHTEYYNIKTQRRSGASQNMTNKSIYDTTYAYIFNISI